MDQYLKVILAFIFVIGLICLLAYFLRRFAGTSFVLGQGAEKKRSLTILEIQPLDSKRRLVLVKRDNKKHLLLLGVGSDVVVESFDE